MNQIDNGPLLEQALAITSAATRLLDKLDQDVVRDTPAKEQTYNMIKLTIEQQSLAIRNLVEHQLQINDLLNKAIEKNPHI